MSWLPIGCHYLKNLKMKKFFKKLFILIISATIYIAIPYLFGSAWLVLSWIPAFFTAVYLDHD